MEKFKLVAPYEPMGDQIEAIKRITDNLLMGIKEQTLLGATGTGKTFTAFQIIHRLHKSGKMKKILYLLLIALNAAPKCKSAKPTTYCLSCFLD